MGTPETGRQAPFNGRLSKAFRRGSVILSAAMLRAVAWRLAAAPQVPFLIFEFILGANLASAPVLLVQWIGFGAVLGVFMIFVGLPVYLLFRGLKVTAPILYVVVAAAIPSGIYILPELLPYRPGSSFSFSTSDCRVIIDNERTPCGWDQFNRGMLNNLIGGSAAGLVFYGLLRVPATHGKNSKRSDVSPLG